MNLIESIFESIKKSIKQFAGEIPYDIETYVIGSGGNFEIHENITLNKAHKIYEEYKKTLPLGKKTEKKDVGNAIMEAWHTMESQTGITYTFMFKANKIIRHDPNEVIKEWNERKEKIEKTKNEIIKELTNTKVSTKSKKRIK